MARSGLLRRILPAVALFGLLAGWMGAPWALAQVIHTDHGPNAASQINKHYVVLVSLDGFRWDYATKYGATHLLAIGARGASARRG